LCASDYHRHRSPHCVARFALARRLRGRTDKRRPSPYNVSPEYDFLTVNCKSMSEEAGRTFLRFYYRVLCRALQSSLDRTHLIFYLIFVVGAGIISSLVGKSFDSFGITELSAFFVIVSLVVLVRLLFVNFQFYNELYRKYKATSVGKLQCSFDFRNNRCFIVDEVGDRRYRVEVSVIEGREIKACRASILKIIRPNKTEVIIEHGLPFAPSQDNQLQPVDIVHGQVRYVDVLYISKDNSVTFSSPRWPSDINTQEIFSSPGLYDIQIRITSPFLDQPTDYELKYVR
jgi:hypothetical protein